MVCRYGQPVFALIVRLVADTMVAEELTQDTFLKAFSHIGSYDPKRASLATWPSRPSLLDDVTLTAMNLIKTGLLVHVLRVADINDSDGVALDDVGVVPPVGVRHVVCRSSADGGPAARQCAFYSVDGKEGIAHVSLHVLIRI